MCPLRVFLILFSFLVALIAVLFSMRDVWWPKAKKQNTAAVPVAPPKSWSALAWEFVTLRYIYNKTKEWRAALSPNATAACPLAAKPTATAATATATTTTAAESATAVAAAAAAVPSPSAPPAEEPTAAAAAAS